MPENYILLDVSDPKSILVAEILSNKTAQKIIGLLAETELSETDISQKLSIPLNTVGYNIKKLKEAGLIEAAPKYFWSVKGKRIPLYRVSNKKIVISPRRTFKGILPSVLLSGLASLGVYYGIKRWQVAQYTPVVQDMALSAGASSSLGDISLKALESATTPGVYLPLVSAVENSLWFFIGSIAGLVIFLILNWKKVWK